MEKKENVTNVYTQWHCLCCTDFTTCVLPKKTHFSAGHQDRQTRNCQWIELKSADFRPKGLGITSHVYHNHISRKPELEQTVAQCSPECPCSVRNWSSQISQSLKPHPHTTSPASSHDSHLFFFFMAETFYPIQPGWQIGHKLIPPSFITLQYQLLIVYFQQLREETWVGRAGQEDLPVNRNLTSEYCCSLTGAQQSDAYELKGNTLVEMFIRWLQRGKIKMGGNISQKKGSRRASSRSHGNSVMWVRTLTCLILILQWIIKKTSILT